MGVNVMVTIEETHKNPGRHVFLITLFSANLNKEMQTGTHTKGVDDERHKILIRTTMIFFKKTLATVISAD